MVPTPKKKVKTKVAKKKKSVTPRGQKTITDGDYIATLSVNDEKYDASGDTALVAFQNLAAQVPKLGMLKTKAVLTLTYGDRESSQAFYVLQLRRFLINFVAMQIWAKRLETALRKSE